MTVLTAVDYVYLDQATALYQSTKELISSWAEIHGLSKASDKGVKGRPGIPGTLKTLNQRVQLLVEAGEYETAAKLIGRKVTKAYRLGPTGR